MKKSQTWVLVADGAHAKVFETDRTAKQLSIVPGGEFNAESLPNRMINADRPGEAVDRSGHGRRRMQPRTDAHQHAETQLLKQVAEYLSKAHLRQSYGQLVIIAPPKALGSLRSQLTPGVKKCVIAEVAKDFVHLKERELLKHVEAVFRP